MDIEHIEKTPRYEYKRIIQTKDDTLACTLTNQLVTTYLHSGTANLKVIIDGEENEYPVRAGQGVVVTPGISYCLTTEDRFLAFEVSSEVDVSQPIIEIVDDGYSIQEVPLSGYKVIDNPKRVTKPWGHELWIIWTKDYHVLKQIGMKRGRQSSLQLHEKKLETNYLISGEADVVDGYSLEVTLSEDEMNKAIEGVNFDEYKNRKKPGDHWTSRPGVIHRVISVVDYLAYEVSTPELDDVIRLADDSGRKSGRIDKEHR